MCKLTSRPPGQDIVRSQFPSVPPSPSSQTSITFDALVIPYVGPYAGPYVDATDTLHAVERGRRPHFACHFPCRSGADARTTIRGVVHSDAGGGGSPSFAPQVAHRP